MELINFATRLLYPGNKHRYSPNRRLDEPQSRFGRLSKRENLLPLPGFGPQTVRPVASRYTDYAVPLLSYNLPKQYLILLEIFSLRWDIILVMCTITSPFTYRKYVSMHM
jgi:hypothetical protein